MSVIRTSLSLIGFGFIIFQFFRSLQESAVLTSSASFRNFGTALVFLGIGMLVFGISYQVRFMLELHATRQEMVDVGLVHGASKFPPSLTFVTAVFLLLIGIAAVVSMFYYIGPFA